MPSGALTQVLRPLQSMFAPSDYPDLLAGLDSPDDAAVYRLDDQRALIATTDFFTPIVDDPYDYGAIAAANSISDAYAMGGTPMLALSIAALPTCVPMETLTQIMRGMGEKAREAGAVIAGGHTVKDNEPKVGLCVLALAHPEKVLIKGGLQVGNVLALTKPLGSGIITTAAKRDKANLEHLASAVTWMKRLNRNAGEVAVELGLRGGTDITGFGLLGHAWEMAQASRVGLRFFVNDIPFMDGVRNYATEGLFPGGAKVNRENYQPHIRFDNEVPEPHRMLLVDPQTSGGLLLAVPREQRAEFEKRMAARDETCWIIGEVVEGNEISVHLNSVRS